MEYSGNDNNPMLSSKQHLKSAKDFLSMNDNNLQGIIFIGEIRVVNMDDSFVEFVASSGIDFAGNIIINTAEGGQ